MPNIKKIEEKWLSNFKKSELVKNEKYNSEVASSLFYGFEKGIEHSDKFESGFRDFIANFDFSNPESQTPHFPVL